MKKIVPVLAFLILSLASAAQKGEHEIGINLIPNVSTMPEFEDPVMGGGFGISYCYNISDHFALESGVNYIMLNQDHIESDWIALDYFHHPTWPNRGTKSEGFFELPLYLKLRLSLDPDARFQLYLMGGYSFAFKVNEITIEYYDDYVEFRNVKWHEEESYAHFANLALGLTYQFKDDFTVGLRPQLQVMQNFPWYEPDIENVLSLNLSIVKRIGR